MPYNQERVVFLFFVWDVWDVWERRGGGMVPRLRRGGWWGAPVNLCTAPPALRYAPLAHTGIPLHLHPRHGNVRRKLHTLRQQASATSRLRWAQLAAEIWRKFFVPAFRVFSCREQAMHQEIFWHKVTGALSPGLVALASEATRRICWVRTPSRTYS